MRMTTAMMAALAAAALMGCIGDPVYGFPASVRIDFEKQVADEEYGLSISDFRPVDPIP